LAHLRPAHQPEVDGKSDVIASRLLLLVDSHMVALFRGKRKLGEILELMAQASLDQSAELLGAVVVDHELEPRLDPRDPILGGRAPYVDYRPQHVHRLIAGDEDAEMARQAGRR